LYGCRFRRVTRWAIVVDVEYGYGGRLTELKVLTRVELSEGSRGSRVVLPESRLAEAVN
jgi:hypothetical protein